MTTGELSSAEIAKFSKIADEHEAKIQLLEKEINALQSAYGSKDLKYAEELREMNRKLKYRKLHLEKNIAEAMGKTQGGGDGKKQAANKNDKKGKKEKKEKDSVAVPDPSVVMEGPFVAKTFEDMKDTPLHMLNMGQEVSRLMACATHNAFAGYDVSSANGVQLSFRVGDYQCNAGMKIPKLLKGHPNAPANPIEAAKRIVEHVPENNITEKIEVTPPGFINIFVKKQRVEGLVSNLAKYGAQAPLLEKKRCGVDFSAPNIAKEMHAGHIRSTIIGDSICRLFEFVGWDVDRINHIGDWGTQFGMLITHLKELFPNYATETPEIADLQTFYQESKKRFDESEEFKKLAQENVVALQSGDRDVTNCWKMICKISKVAYDKIYKELDIVIEDKGESFYQQFMPGVIRHLSDKGVLVEEDGRKLVWPKDEKVPLTVQKTGGGYTYATSDLAALDYRVNKCKFNIVIYVVDNGQSMHLESVYNVGRMVGYYDPKDTRVEHVGFGVMQAPSGKKFKTREGSSVRLRELLDEARERSRAILMEKGRDKELTQEEFEAAERAIAYGAVKYADLSKTRTADYQFSFDSMLQFKGNTAVYLL
eukprot:Nk52_evm69s32 gene=Nk52_evmTU69s32